MGRKLCGRLKRRLRSGDLQELNAYLLNNKNELRFEVRRGGDAFVYYRKGKALEVRGQKVDKKYGDTPDCSLSVTNPKFYFDAIKKVIDQWLTQKQRAEFDTQQKVATFNSNIKGNYIILDMEYSFSLAFLPKENRPKSIGFDLVGVERTSGKLCVFEVKTGLGAIDGKAGVAQHVKDFNDYFHGEYANEFKQSIYDDMTSILADKVELGYMEQMTLRADFMELDPELIFIFEEKNIGELEKFKKTVAEVGSYKVIQVSEDNNYQLCR